MTTRMMPITNDANEDRGDLQKLQNSILRAALEINNPRDISTVNLHFETNSLLLDKRRKLQLIVAIFKTVNNKTQRKC